MVLNLNLPSEASLPRLTTDTLNLAKPLARLSSGMKPAARTNNLSELADAMKFGPSTEQRAAASTLARGQTGESQASPTWLQAAQLAIERLSETAAPGLAVRIVSTGLLPSEAASGQNLAAIQLLASRPLAPGNEVKIFPVSADSLGRLNEHLSLAIGFIERADASAENALMDRFSLLANAASAMLAQATQAPASVLRLSH